MLELPHSPEPHEAPQEPLITLVEPPNVDHYPAEATPHEPIQSPKPSTLRRALGHIATLLRPSPKRDLPKAINQTYSPYDGGVDEFGLPKSSAKPPTNANTALVADPIPRRIGEFVKNAPRFLDQVEDISRTNLIEYVTDVAIPVGTQTQDRETAIASEHDTLVAIRDFLREAAVYTNAQGEHSLAPLATSMTENLTFITERDYDEAVAWFAEDLRRRLQSNETKQLYISATIAEKDDSVIKSSAYLLDNIIKHFSDEELAAWKGRLVIDPSELTADPKETSIILLDDWTISGAQLQHSAQSLIKEYPDYQKQIEVQLIAATKDRIRDGLKLDGEYSRVGSIPINAYYAAHAADMGMANYSGAHITGAHCAADYDFNDQMASMAITLGKFMPPGTNIVRPYRKPGYRLTQLQRLHT